jgi:hypothetical protein
MGERRERATGRVYFHPQRGVIVAEIPLNPRWHRYRGGADDGWRELTPIEVERNADGSLCPLPGQRLPKGFLWGDASRQRYGMGGPELILGPLENDCRDCRRHFVFAAEEQKHWYETLRFMTDSTAVRCPGCRRTRRRIENARRAWAAALRAAETESSADHHLAAARAALALRKAGGGVRLDKALSHCNKAARLGAGAAAEELRDALRRSSPDEG